MKCYTPRRWLRNKEKDEGGNFERYTPRRWLRKL